MWEEKPPRPLIRADLELGEQIAEVSLVGDRQESPGSSPGIPPPSGLGELQAVPQPRVCLQGPEGTTE